ncbi:Rieske 2Fe-2S domain-containing protein [Paenibacillus sp. tmac-D7]|uniref:aromatic ring-hydroxylating oxygenase subunit alpha n=1 Tax=Paenibacillus sp. tmac-D7 TaxID=2591462 RepID=UPI001143B010|nr:aromatic ring-hydroxylating dioxygenase subunit alpha [Paenibacillus sp. tmac-D7]
MKNSTVENKTLNLIQEKLSAGRLPQWVKYDPEIFELEIEKIFSKTWCFLAHESELKEHGSYVTRYIGNDPILVTRTRTGEIKAFLNSCTHRGAKLCTADYGNSKNLTCPYHGWTFNPDGELIGVTAGNRIYGEEMVKDEWALRPVPKLDRYAGLIFGNLDSNASSLDEYLGELKWYLDILVSRTDGGMEVLGAPQRWVVNTNWKVTAENFCADSYHALTSHRSTVEMGISPDFVSQAGFGYQLSLNNGHGLNLVLTPPEVEGPKYQGLPEELWPMFERNLNPDQLQFLENLQVHVGNCFPNLSWVSIPQSTGGDSITTFLNMRVWRPIGPDSIEICSWVMIDKEANEEYKKEASRAYIISFGPGGTLEEDDTEIWTRITESSKAVMARNKDLSYDNVLNYLMGIDRVMPIENFPGPGKAYPTWLLDTAIRNFWEQWLKMLQEN